MKQNLNGHEGYIRMFKGSIKRLARLVFEESLMSDDYKYILIFEITTKDVSLKVHDSKSHEQLERVDLWDTNSIFKDNERLAEAQVRIQQMESLFNKYWELNHNK